MMAWYARALEAFRVPVTPHCVPTRHGDTHLLTAGDPIGPPVVLLHGINVNAIGWRSQIERLASRYYLIAPDVIGCAGKSDAHRLPYAGRAYADWLSDTLAPFGVRRALVVGSSGGGYFALKLAVYYPQQVGGILLINPCGICRYPYPTDFFRWQWVVNLAGWVGRRIATPANARRLVRAGASPDVPLDETIVQMAYLLLKYFRRQPPPGALPPGELRAVRAPVRLLVSEHEPYYNPRYLIAQARRHLPQVDVHLIANAGHDIHHDQADVVAGHIVAFHRRLSGADPAAG